MSKVWIVSGIVLVGTGLALAGFGAWLSGNANCDAGDFGRSCVAASLAVSVIGLALSLGGWLRIRRMQGVDASEEGAGDLVVRRPGLVILAMVVVGLVLLTVALPGPQPPVKVFVGSAPDYGEDPAVYLAADLGGQGRTDLTTSNDGLARVAEGGYGTGAFVRVTRFNASANWTYYPPCIPDTSSGVPTGCPTVPDEVRHNRSVANATLAADGYLAGQYSALGGSDGTRLCVREGPRLWFAHEGTNSTALAWRDGTFVFEVTAPTAAARNAIAAALGAAS